MRNVRVIAGIVIALMGGVWTLQGLNSELAPQSFMTNDRTWVWIGILTIVAGIGLARWAWTRR